MSTNEPLTQKKLDTIQAQPTVTDDMVERAARALWIDNEKNIAFLFEDEDGSGDIDPSGWSRLSLDSKRSWLELACAALDAALHPGEEA